MFPCREGTGWMEKILKNIEYGKGKMSDIDLLWDIQSRIEGNTICPLGDAAAWPVAAAIRHFRDEFEWHVFNPDECLKEIMGWRIMQMSGLWQFSFCSPH